MEQHAEELRVLREMAKANGQLGAAIKAEELRGKLRGFHVERLEHSKASEFDQMSDDELRAFVMEEAKALGILVTSTNSRRNGARHRRLLHAGAKARGLRRGDGTGVRGQASEK